jgi:AmiR/NasT family two-component response regulator
VDRADTAAVEFGTLEEASAAVSRLFRATGAAYERAAQLETALESRIVIEQAKGMLAERLSIELDEAFELIRASARANRIKLRDLAERVTVERETPREIASRLHV